MKVILLDRIHKLGNLGEVVNVKPGFGRNYLIPQGKAVSATAANIAHFEAKRAEFEQDVAAKTALAHQRAEALNKLIVTIPMLVGDEGKLYGSVGATELVDALVAAGAEAHKNEVLLPNGPIREVGEYEVQLSLHHGDVIATVKVNVVAQ